MIRLSSPLQLCCLTYDTFEINLLLVPNVIQLSATATESFSLDNILPGLFPLPLDPLLHHPLVDLLFHVVDVFEDFLLSLVASDVHENEILDIILIPVRSLVHLEPVQARLNLRAGEGDRFMPHSEHFEDFVAVEACRLLFVA